tara:strand:+ start:604 stop:1248 length:645 start_codon:yes stop_codon:yes gene_type:complete
MLSDKLNEKGFSLLEVIVALSILAAGFVTVLQLFSKSIHSVETSDEYLKAISLAHHKMNGLELDDFKTNNFSGIFDNEPGYRWELSLEPYDTPVNDKEINIQVAKVKLNIIWNYENRERNFEIVTLRTIGNTYPSTDKVWLGKETSGIYGKIGGGGVFIGVPSSSLIKRNLERLSEESADTNDLPEVRFCGVDIPGVNISGMGTGDGQMRISGN